MHVTCDVAVHEKSLKLIVTSITVNYAVNDDDIQEFDKKSLKYIYAQSIVQNYNSMMIENPNAVDWTRLAYVFYATDPDRLIPIIINVTQLRKLETKAQINVICSFDIDSGDRELTKRMLVLEQDNVQITHVKPLISKFNKDQKYWRDSFTKLYAFNLTQYARVIFMDADAIVLRLMDHLFFIPPALLASTINYLDFKDTPIPSSNGNDDTTDPPPTPLEYVLAVNDLYKKLIVEEYNFDAAYFWKLYNELPSMEFAVDSLADLRLASYFMVIQPNTRAFEWLLSAVESKKPEEYDMEIVNNVWKLSDVINKNVFVTRETSNSNNWLKHDKIPALLILPHNPYGLVSGEFRHDLFQHAAYLTTPVDFPYLRGKQTSLSIRRIVSDVDYSSIEDAMDKFAGVGYWDWAWRFGEKEDEGLDKVESKIKWKSDRLKAIYQSEEINFNIDIFGWESKKVYENAYYIHWSDWPLNKPWMLSSLEDGGNPMFTKIGYDSKVNCIESVKKN
ncbi:hypothetical protein CANINC_002882 [Pichia inconspicua]|uniref:Glycosyltransferase family 8 protein n=1 Tax=Pichia inconspicua TaxID=52247 RepID=A0A4T0X1C5_9ASCO|nr:hypothetical protein CANINC_002882 [[Candida] inconspicua]